MVTINFLTLIPNLSLYSNQFKYLLNMHRCLIKNNNRYEKIKNMYQVLVCNNDKNRL